MQEQAMLIDLMKEDWVRWEYNHIPHASFRHLTCGFIMDDNDERREYFRIPYTHDNMTEEQKCILKERIEMPPKIDPLQVITLERTPDAIWQAFLLHITYMFTGYRWHGGYVHKKLVFSKKDVLAIKPELLPILTIDDKTFIPEIAFDEDNPEKGYIKCNWWSEWGGLFDVTAKFSYSDITNRIEFIEILSSNIIKYQCGVMY